MLFGISCTIDVIRSLRMQAEEESSRCNYDPQNFTERRVKALEAYADYLETQMETRLGWRREEQ